MKYLLVLENTIKILKEIKYLLVLENTIKMLEDKLSFTSREYN